nr:aminotransferase class V-fold PLP-dependent enzyme [Paracoccaceae bacterium]
MIPSQRALFDLPREIAYLNCAYMSPLLTEAVEIGQAALARKARPWTIRPADFFAETGRARTLFARLIGADEDGVALVPAASYGLATAAANLPLGAGRTIVIAADQFPSNVHPWRAAAAAAGASVVTATPGPEGDLTAALLAAIDERTAIVACAQCRWTDGALVDLVRVGAAARAAGAALVLDLTQSAGALPIDVAAVRPDFLVTAAYKWLLGPYSTGFLWVAPQHRAGRPLEEHWLGRAGAEDFTRLVDYSAAYAPGARRFDMGEAPNFALLPAACAALE